MKIKELYVENFGKLSRYKISFDEGLNSFTEDNGYGKTTLSVFIKTMLYGFDESRRHSLDENDRKKYTPWQGGAFGGYLVFEANGTSYRVERTFGQKASEDTYKLYDLNTGRSSEEFSSNLGEELFGIDSDGFERTIFLSEKNLSGKNTNQTISAKLSNLVGTEGDIGGFDEAIKLLDERRKFYQKRGGSGEIRDVEYEISELEDRIKILSDKRSESIKTEAQITRLAEKISVLKEEKRIILEREQREKLEREKRGYERQYREMLGALKTDEDRERELLAFFKEKIPTGIELSSAAESNSEIKRLRRTVSDMGENSELIALKEFFKNETTSLECDKMNESAKRISEYRSTVMPSAAAQESVSVFKRVPKASEIDGYIAEYEAQKNVKKAPNIPLSFVGAALIVLGLVTGLLINVALCSLSIIGILLTIISILPLFSQKSSNNPAETAENFIREIYGDLRAFDSPYSALFTMKRDLEEYSQRLSADALAKQQSDAILQSVIAEEKKVRDFSEKFPVAEGLTLEERTGIIAYKRRRFELLLEFESERESDRKDYKEKIALHEEKLRSFVSLFPTKTDDPIAEIQRNLAEYEVIKASLSRRRGDIERFASSHGIAPITAEAPILPSDNAEGNDLCDAAAIEDQLLSLEREKARIETDYLISVKEIDSIEELEERLREKKEKVQLLKDNLSVITKTKDMLAVARDSMTARYLDTTKRGFEKYLSLIDAEEDGFTIDTSFTIMKTDLGKSRQAEAYSRGTRDMHALAMRLALIDALYTSETPPIILDDPFTAFDDKHTQKAADVLAKIAKDKQIIYFTCSRSRKIK